MQDRPVLYSFRRCPYAMRARLGVQSSGVVCELREIVLKDKAPAFLAASPSKTVPALVTPDGTVIDESLDIMLWALQVADPERWLTPETGTLDDMLELIAQSDGPFKASLDRYKYPNRYAETDPLAERSKAGIFLRGLDTRLGSSPSLFGSWPALADMAILPFVRQFAHVDRTWFDQQNWTHLQAWLAEFLDSSRFRSIMTAYPKWQEGDPATIFPDTSTS